MAALALRKLTQKTRPDLADLFFYGTLRHVPLLELVLGRPAAAIAVFEATLADHAVYWVQDQPFPMIVAEAGHTAPGLLVRDLTEDDLARLAFYEGGFDYGTETLNVTAWDETQAQAQVFFPKPGRWTPGKPWSLRDWVDAWGPVSVTAAAEVMAYYGKVGCDRIADSFQAIRTRAWAKLAARQRGSGADSRSPGDVIVHRHTHAYVNYFGMEEIQISHRHYDGTMGPVLDRSALMQGSAVVVLPYDPQRDTVLLVEQFRPPVFLIDDPDPWMWEPVAGMIDPGETPEAAALREAQEEAQIALAHLEPAGRAYSSSGSSTEFLYLFVGLADLTHTTQAGGKDTEGEDIRSQIIPFADFIDRVDRGCFKDLPLLSLAHWLARHRERLRG